MEWISNNWFLLLIAALCIGMHFFGRGHGKHGKHEKEECDEHMSNDEAKNEKKDGGGCH